MLVHCMTPGKTAEHKTARSECSTDLVFVAGLITARASHRGVIASQMTVSATSSCRQGKLSCACSLPYVACCETSDTHSTVQNGQRSGAGGTSAWLRRIMDHWLDLRHMPAFR